MPITAPSNAAVVPLGKHWPRCPTKYAGLCARRCDGTSATMAAQSNWRPSTALPVADAREGLQATLELKSFQSRKFLLCRRLLGWPASESGRLCHGDGGHEWGNRLRRSFMLTIL